MDWIFDSCSLEDFTFTEEEYQAAISKLKSGVPGREALMVIRGESLKLQKNLMTTIDKQKEELAKKDRFIQLLKEKIQNQQDEIKNWKKEAQSHQEDAQIQRKMRIQREVKEISNNIIISGLPLHLQAIKEQRRTETDIETLNVVKTFLKSIKAKTNNISFVKRFQLKEDYTNKDREYCPCVKVSLQTYEAKRELFSKLKFIPKSPFKLALIKNEYPKSLKGSLNALNLKAYKLRIESRIRTRIVINDGQLFLERKEGKRWLRISHSDSDDEHQTLKKTDQKS